MAVLLGAGGETGRHPEQHEDAGQEPRGHRQEEKEGPGGAGSQQVSLSSNISVEQLLPHW